MRRAPAASDQEHLGAHGFELFDRVRHLRHETGVEMNGGDESSRETSSVLTSFAPTRIASRMSGTKMKRRNAVNSDGSPVPFMQATMAAARSPRASAFS
jgi:hypothetical protein